MGRIEEKKKLVNELKERIKSAKAVLIASIDGVPCDLMNEIRAELRGKAFVKVVKKNILIKALEGTEAAPLAQYITGSPAIILTDGDIFDIFKIVREKVAYGPLKPGKPAPEDVVVRPGPTGLPAPMLGEIKSAGIPVRVNKGVIEIEKEEVVVKKGENVSPQLANVLLMLNIKPVKKELYVLAGIEDGVVYTREVLSIDEEYAREAIAQAYGKALGLATVVKYPVKQNVVLFISEAHGKAMALAIAVGVITKATVKHLFAQAAARAKTLNAFISGEPASTPKEEKEEEKKEEEVKEEKEEDAAAGLSALFG